MSLVEFCRVLPLYSAKRPIFLIVFILSWNLVFISRSTGFVCQDSVRCYQPASSEVWFSVIPKADDSYLYVLMVPFLISFSFSFLWRFLCFFKVQFCQLGAFSKSFQLFYLYLNVYIFLNFVVMIPYLAILLVQLLDATISIL